MKRSALLAGGGLVAAFLLYLLVAAEERHVGSTVRGPEPTGEALLRGHADEAEAAARPVREPVMRAVEERPAMPKAPLVHGIVLDEDERPVHGGLVQVGSREEAEVGEDGTFVLCDRGSLGSHGVLFKSDEYFSDGHKCLILEGVKLVLFAQKIPIQSVLVLDEGGAPAPGCLVTSHLYNPAMPPVTTDEEGRCLVPAMDRRWLLARSPDGLRYAYGGERRGQETVLRIEYELQPVRIRLKAMPMSAHLKGLSARVTAHYNKTVEAHATSCIVGGSPVTLYLHVIPVRSSYGKFAGNITIDLPGRERRSAWTGAKKIDAVGEGVLTLYVEDPQYEVTLRLRDSGGNPIRRYECKLERLLREPLDQHSRAPPRLRAVTDDDGIAVIQCPGGVFEGPGGVRICVEGNVTKEIPVGFSTCYGTIEPFYGRVRVNDTYAEIHDGKWYAQVEDAPGSMLTAELLYRPGNDIRASTAVQAGGPPVVLRARSPREPAHHSTICVKRNGHLTPTQFIRLDTLEGVRPQTTFWFFGFRRFDLSIVSAGAYRVIVEDTNQRKYHFASPIEIGNGNRAIVVDLDDAARIYDMRTGRLLEER